MRDVRDLQLGIAMHGSDGCVSLRGLQLLHGFAPHHLQTAEGSMPVHRFALVGQALSPLGEAIDQPRIDPARCSAGAGNQQTWVDA